ncbi:C40 family peptidase [Photobacterium sp. GB-36]|uniref:C40 family peptidase n=1 Tax=Photobacterium sp. GB-36 TaxID=2022108 RepID=UPI001E2F7456|nr:NlpC/P60 family protein [Photobacterium sp. GB-36]
MRLSQKWRAKIWHAYSHWAHTPYLYGGNSHHGIDCSAFVRRVFNEVYHVHLPRTTLQQVKLGYKVRKENLHYGDLVFFKTSGWHHHVGIYLDHGRFVNATSSRGVAISNINHPYWRKRLWQIRRLVD